MVVDPKDVVPFLTWLPGAVLDLAGGGGVRGRRRARPWVGWWRRCGTDPGPATRITVVVLREAVLDLAHLSPRRVWALARLAIQESIRRRVVVVFAVFILILLFAGWFLDPGSIDPARLYLDFVLTATSYLVLLLALFLSSLESAGRHQEPHAAHGGHQAGAGQRDRAWGGSWASPPWGLCCWWSWARSATCSWNAGLAHTHQLTADDLHPVEGSVAGQPAVLEGRTSRVHQHRHKVIIEPNGQGHVEMEQGHWHELTVQQGGRQDHLSPRSAGRHAAGPRARLRQAHLPRPHRQANREGRQRGRRMEVPQLTSRAGRLAACVWTFDGITEEAFPNGLPVEMSIEVFRTYKGDIEKGVPGSLSVRKPGSGREAGGSADLRVEGVHDRHAVHPPPVSQIPTARSTTCSRTSSTTARSEIWLQCVDAAAVLWRRAGRPVPPRPRRLLRAELRQGILRHLAADDVGDRVGRDVQHVPQRPGGHAGHLGGAAGRVLQRLHVPPGHRPDLRRRAVRVAHPPVDPAERDVARWSPACGPPWPRRSTSRRSSACG